jgi:hypothetical protein
MTLVNADPMHSSAARVLAGFGHFCTFAGQTFRWIVTGALRW